MTEEDPIWLVWSNEHAAWWRPNWRGYTCIIKDAGRYPKRVADQICREANYGGRVNEVTVLAPEALEAMMRPAEPPKRKKPRLNTEIIEAAAVGHFGKRGRMWDSIDGISMTVDSYDWNFRQAFTRMWHAAWAEIERQNPS